MSATFDSTTKAAYDAATTAQARAEAIVASLTGTISVKVFNGSNTEMGSGTMADPWATAVAGAVVLGEVSSFTVGTTATPDANWYIRFQNADVSRWARGSFGLSGADYNWSLATWEAGQTGTIGTATIVATGNAAPVFTVAPTSATRDNSGGTIQFTATDPEGGGVFYSLTTTRAGITINSATGLVTITAAAADTSGNIVVQASDGILTASATCAVTVSGSAIRYAPGIYIEPGLGDTSASIVSKLYSYDSRIRGVFLRRYWRYLETAKGVYDWSFLDTIHDACEATGRKLVVRVQTRSFGSTDPNSTCPAYLQSEGLTYTIPSRTRSGAALWRTDCTSYLIELNQQIAARYAGGNVLIGLSNEETTLGMTQSERDDYTPSGFVNELIRAMQESRAYAPELAYWIYPNGLNFDDSTFTVLRTLHAACRTDLGVVFGGGPDLNTLDPAGRGAGINILTGDIGGVDHRDDYMVLAQTESDDWADGATAAQLYTDMSTFFRANYMVWSTNPTEWASLAYPYLSGRTAVTTVPRLLEGLVEVL